jgi:hypothetical protein
LYASGRFLIPLILLFLILRCSTTGQRRGIHRKIEEGGYSNITVMDLIDKMVKDDDFILLDGRSSDEYIKGYVKGLFLFHIRR